MGHRDSLGIAESRASHRTLPILDVCDDPLLKLGQLRLLRREGFSLRLLRMLLLLLGLSLADRSQLPRARIQRPGVSAIQRFQAEHVAVGASGRAIARRAHLCHCDQKRPNLIISLLFITFVVENSLHM